MADGELDLRSLEVGIALRQSCLERSLQWPPKNL